MLRLGIVALVLFGCACVRQAGPRTAEEACAEVNRAAREGKLDRLFDLLDKNTRWSIMSVVKDQKQSCALILAHYPKDRRDRELRRCSQAAGAADAKAFFVAYAREHHQAIVEPLIQAATVKARHGGGARVELEGPGGRLAFCEEDKVWTFCGLQQRFEQLKLKAARDLMTVQESTEAYR